MKIEKILCLSLPEAEGRRESFRSSFDTLGIPIHFIEGINGKKDPVFPPTWLSSFKPHVKYQDELRRSSPVLNVTLSKTEKACAIGHLKMWKLVAEHEGDEYFLICEDDAVPIEVNSFPFDFRALCDEIVGNQLVYLGYTDNTQSNKIDFSWPAKYLWHKVKRFPTSSLKNRFAFNTSVHVRPMKILGKRRLKSAGQHWGAFAYLLNSTVANELIRLNLKLHMTSDGTMRYARLSDSFNISVASPGLVFVDESFGSYIRSEQEHEENFKKLRFG